MTDHGGFALLCLENPLLGNSVFLRSSNSAYTFQIFKGWGEQVKQAVKIMIGLTQNRDEQMLEKYGLKANDAILAEEKHMGLYEDLMQNHDAKLIAGGAAQNTARGAQVRPYPFLPQESTSLLQ